MIQTERCSLELLEQKDFDGLLEMYQEPDAFKYIAPLRNKEKSFYLDFLARKLKEISSGKGYYWLIKERNSKALIGAINLTPIPNTEKMQIGWQLKTAYHRQGLAYEAASAALQFGLNETKIDPIYAVFEVGNIASEKMIKRMGFSKLEERTEAGVKIETHTYKRT